MQNIQNLRISLPYADGNSAVRVIEASIRSQLHADKSTLKKSLSTSLQDQDAPFLKLLYVQSYNKSSIFRTGQTGKNRQ
jgi:hypothetical protein